MYPSISADILHRAIHKYLLSFISKRVLSDILVDLLDTKAFER